MAVRGVLAAAAVAVGVTSASAQAFGTFTWQLQPYCNRITLTLMNVTGNFTLDGSDDQCGATNRASAVGVGTFNASGNVTLNFTIVTAPSGKPVHVSAVVSPASGAGTWTDSVGNSGAFAFFGNVPGLPPRPLPASGLAAGVITTTELAPGAVGASDIDPAAVQVRVSGVCAAGQAMTGVHADGTVTCQSLAPAFKRTTFDIVVPPVTTPAVNAATLTFTPPVTGMARLEAVGYCNLLAGAASPNDTGVQFLFGESEADALDGPFETWGLGRISGAVPAGGVFQLTLAGSRLVPVTAGVPSTVRLWIRHESGAVSTTCRGEFTATVMVEMP